METEWSTTCLLVILLLLGILLLLVLLLILVVAAGAGVRLEAVLRRVEASLLNLLGHAHADGEVDAHEEDSGGDEHPRDNGKAANHLHAELLAALARLVHVGVGSVLDVGVGAEHAGGEKAPRTAHAVHNRGVAGVIDAQPEEDLVADVEHAGADEADHDGHPRLDNRAVGGDGHEAREDAVEAHRHVEHAIEDLGQEGRGDARHGSSDGGGHGDLAGYDGSSARDRERRAAVEPVPPEPQDEDSERLERLVAVMELGGGAVLLEAASARANNDRANQARHAADHVHDARAGEVDQAVGGAVLVENRAGDAVLVGVGAPGREPASAPAPMHNHRVDEGRKHN
mmetsp:Transcript_34905/g.25295  ORF Transcript_34905/g.25295 Transcript_34905/m.25295 type:complete len:342 (+) Transcript_34905:80-1105(+)